jgi:ribosome-associated protein
MDDTLQGIKVDDEASAGKAVSDTTATTDAASGAAPVTDATAVTDTTSSAATVTDVVSGAAALLVEHKAGNVTILDMRKLNSWTDFFVIATVTSSTHLGGLLRHITKWAADAGVDILRKHRKVSHDDEWNLVDMGDIVIHLMTEKARNFYELERLWSEATMTKVGE